MSEKIMQLDIATYRQLLSDGLIARNAWTKRRPDGREALCTRLALFGSKAVSGSVCPAWFAAPWLYHLLPWMDDAGTQEAWYAQQERLADLLDRSRVLNAAAWRRADYRARLAALHEARSHVSPVEVDVLAAVNGVIALCERVVAGDDPSAEEWAVAAAAAAAAKAATEAARAARAAEAADRIITGILDGIEAEIVRMEAA